ncbi:MAG: PilZ domain-containing protein [Candidatus Aureabacteria bacterium]|nr:PilZ domain-containing protein [Candidatus Auribacterota bacterium]
MDPQQSDDAERRNIGRLMTDLPVQLTVLEDMPGGATPKFYGGRVINLSEEGLAIETCVSTGRDVFRDRQKVSAEITLPHTPQPIRLSGDATWGTRIENPWLKSTTLRLGLKISEISPQDAARLKDFITQETSR